MSASTLNVEKFIPGDNAGSVNTSTTIKSGALFGLNSSGAAVLAQSDSGSVVMAIGFNPTGDKTAGQYIAAARHGVVGGFSGLTIGGVVYLCASTDTAANGGPSGAGGYTQTRPAGASSKLVQEVGVAISATEVLVDIRMSGLLA